MGLIIFIQKPKIVMKWANNHFTMYIFCTDVLTCVPIQ